MTQGLHSMEGIPAVAGVITVTAYVTLIVSLTLPLQLRGDMDHIDWLKSLPLNPVAVAAGEMLGPALFMSMLNLSVFLPASLVVSPSWMLLVAAVCALPVNLLFFAVDNFVFTLYPVRQTPATPGDLQFAGLRFAHTLLKFLLLGLMSIPVALVGTVAWMIAGPWRSIPAMWITIAGLDIVMIILDGRAFGRFDPAADTPA